MFLSPKLLSWNFQMHTSNCLLDICTCIPSKHHILNTSTLNSKWVSAKVSTFPGKWNERPGLSWAVHSEQAEWEQMGRPEGIYTYFVLSQNNGNALQQNKNKNHFHFTPWYVRILLNSPPSWWISQDQKERRYGSPYLSFHFFVIVFTVGGFTNTGNKQG